MNKTNLSLTMNNNFSDDGEFALTVLDKDDVDNYLEQKDETEVNIVTDLIELKNGLLSDFDKEGRSEVEYDEWEKMIDNFLTTIHGKKGQLLDFVDFEETVIVFLED